MGGGERGGCNLLCRVSLKGERILRGGGAKAVACGVFGALLAWDAAGAGKNEKGSARSAWKV